MKKLIFIILMLAILPVMHAIALYPAQDIAKEYMLTTENLDSTVYYVRCDSNEYYTMGFLDSRSNLIMFLPIESNNGKVIYESNSGTKKILRTALLYKKITGAGSNYISQQLIDKVDNQAVILQSKSAKLDGIIKSNYSSSINNKCVNTKTKLESLITKLQDLKTKLGKLQKEQSSFIDTTDCAITDNLIYLYKTSFVGYNELVSLSVDYRDSTNEIVEVIVAEQKIDETTKRVVLSYIEAPTTLSSDISTITDYLSSANQFYSIAISDFEKIGPNSTIEVLQQTLTSRQDYFIAKKLLYSYDSELKDNLDNYINYILNSENINLWKEAKTVSELSQNYAQLKELYNKGRYQESISKIKLAKTQVIKIKTSGIDAINTNDVSRYVIYSIIIIIVILGSIILFKKIKFKPKKPKQKYKDIDPNYLLKRKDPFR